MKKIELMSGGFTIVDDSDYEYLSQFKWTDRANGYAGRLVHRNNKQKTILMHREILSAGKDQIVDHINQDKIDNRRSNLRFCCRSTNAMNCKVHKHNTSGYKGVSKSGKNWRSYIVKDNKQIHIGVFKTKEEAAIAYNERAKEIFGEFASINEVIK